MLSRCKYCAQLWAEGSVGVFMDGWMEVLLNEMILMQLLMDEINLINLTLATLDRVKRPLWQAAA